MPLLRLLTVVGLLAPSVWGQLPSGPYVPFVTTTSATVMWVTEQADVRYGADPKTLDSHIPALKANQVTLTGLKPATTYYYEAPGAGRGSFTTPPSGAGDFTFAVYGDTRTRHDVHRKVIEAIVAAKPTFVVHTGDQVADGRNASLWPVFFDISRELLRNTVFIPSLGNHERNAPYWYQFFDKQKGYYSFDWGKIHWVILNSDVSNVTPTPEGREDFWKEQIAWMEKDLEKNQAADFRFVVFHHPPYTAMSRRREAAARIAQRLVPLFRKHKVQAVFGGHDHNYQRHVESGVEYVVTGGGGAPLYEVDAPIPGITVKAESVENYVFATMEARVEGAVVRFEARALDGRVLDRFEIAAPKK